MARNHRRPPAPDPIEELIQLAIDLDLTATAEQARDILARAQAESMSYSDFALALLRAEVLARNNRRLLRSLKRSRLGTIEGLDGFDFTMRPQLEPRVVKELFTCQYAQERRNVLCLGRPGLGKTRIAKAIVHAACLAGYSTLCVVTAEMLEELHASHADASFKRAMRRYVKPAVLLLDSCGVPGYVKSDLRARAGMGSAVPGLHITRSAQPHRRSSHSRIEASSRQPDSLASISAIGFALASAARLVSRSTAA